MGRRGPKPEPAAVKRAKGNPGRRPIGDDPVIVQLQEGETAERALRVISVSPPKSLKGEALQIWKRLAPQLVRLKLLVPIDAETFGRYCRNFARWEKMQRILDSEGETYESVSQHGTLKRAHPAYLIADRLERQLLAAEANFGLNPAERQRIFAQRVANPASADLFGGEGSQKPVTVPPKASRPDAPSSPIGLLN